MRTPGIHTRGDEPERIALEQISGVDEHEAVGIRAAKRIDDGCGARQTTNRVGATRIVIPAGQASVDVGRRRDDEIERLLGAARSGIPDAAGGREYGKRRGSASEGAHARAGEHKG